MQKKINRKKFMYKKNIGCLDGIDRDFIFY